MRGEVLPNEAKLYAHDWELTRAAAEEGGRAGSAAARDSRSLRRPRPRQDQRGVRRRADRRQPVVRRVARRAHLDRHAAARVLRHRRAEGEDICRRLATGEMVGAYALTEPQSGSDALAAKTTADAHADGQHYVLNGQKMWITNGGFADLFTIFAKVNGEKFTAFLVEREHGRGERVGREEAGARRIVDDGADARQRQGAGRERARDDRRGPQGRLQHPQLRPREARRAQHVVRPPGAGQRHGVRERAPAVRQGDRRVRADQAQAGRDGDPLLRRRRDGLPRARRRRPRARSGRSAPTARRC